MADNCCTDDDVIFDITIPRFGKSQLSVMTVRATSKVRKRVCFVGLAVKLASVLKEDKDGWISALREWSDKARSEVRVLFRLTLSLLIG